MGFPIGFSKNNQEILAFAPLRFNPPLQIETDALTPSF